MVDNVYTPGMVNIVNSKTKEVKQVFPVDLREILSSNQDWSVAADGSVEAGRLSLTPLKQLIGSGTQDVVEIVGTLDSGLYTQAAEPAKVAEAPAKTESTEKSPAKPEAKAESPEKK